jgi:hypothetical protein
VVVVVFTALSGVVVVVGIVEVVDVVVVVFGVGGTTVARIASAGSFWPSASAKALPAWVWARPARSWSCLRRRMRRLRPLVREAEEDEAAAERRRKRRETNRRIALV